MKLNKYLFLIFILLSTYICCAQKPQNIIYLQSEEVNWPYAWKYKSGDDLKWANKSYDYSEWEWLKLKDRNLLNEHNGNFWIKTGLIIKDSLASRKIILHHYIMNSALEIYWDSIKIHQNGVVGHDLNSESPGSYTSWAYIPSELLTKGTHYISFRVSNYHFPELTFFGKPNMGNDMAMQRKNYSWALEHTVIVTILGLTTLFCTIFFIGFLKKTSLLFFIAFCFIQILDLMINYYGFYDNISLYQYNLWFEILNFSFLIDGALLIFYFLFEFQILYKRYILLFSLFISIVSSYFGFFDLPITIFIGFLIIGYAIKMKMKTAFYILIGLFLFSFFAYLGYSFVLIWGYYIGVVLLFLSMAIASVIQVYSKLKDQVKLELKSSRLENELLKKNIQPHFIMNSLVSLQQLIYENAEKADDMIDALAAEFHMFSKISEKKLIPLKDELKICEAHLKVMEYRKDAHFKLETIGVEGNELVPPAVFHTLIENGISHGYGLKNEGLFVLKKSVENNGIIYHFFNDGDVDKNKQKHSSGTGMKYVKARLSESFGNAWYLNSGPVEGGWVVEIHIKN